MKKIVSIILASTLALGSISFATDKSGELTTTLIDIQNHWSKSYVERLYKEGYVKGSHGYFNPNSALKTEDFLIMVVRVVDPSSKDLTALEGQKYYQPFVDKALEMGLIQGQYDEVPQYIERMMPRELAVQVIDRALTLRGEVVTADHGLEYKFSDYKIINDINKEAVLRAYQLGIVKGSKGKFMPKNPLARGESAILIAKLLDKSLRDKMVFGNNPKTYDESAEWYMNTYDKIAGKRTVVIEKKADGSINDGDFDFKEVRKWWTDQEFEDRMIDNIYNHTALDFSNVMAGSYDAKLHDLAYTQGNFYVHDGEVGFVNNSGVNTQKAYRFYDNDIPNFNRLVYDLSKYATQFAYEKKLYAKTEYFHNYVMVGIGDVADMQGSARFDIKINADTEYWKKGHQTNFDPAIEFFYNGVNWNQDEVFIKQAIYRIYGKEKGEKAFQFIKANLKNRNSASSGNFTKQNDGIWYFMSDLSYMTPQLITSQK